MKRKIFKISILILTSFLVASCARGPRVATNMDRLEGFNRFMFAFNMDIDHLALRPIAKVYSVITPPPLKKGVHNFFDNVGMLVTIPNDILQGKFRFLLVDIWRFIINTTVGIGGLFDVATRMGLPKHYEDFGLTLAYWGNGRPSGYLVLPFLGPNTVREGYGQLFDFFGSPWLYFKSATPGWAALGLRSVARRSRLLPANPMIDTAFDPYIFVREVYMQKRLQMIAENELPYYKWRKLHRSQGRFSAGSMMGVAPPGLYKNDTDELLAPENHSQSAPAIPEKKHNHPKKAEKKIPLIAKHKRQR